MGLFSFVGGLFGGGSQKKASRKAEAALVGAMNRGIDVQNQQYQQTRSDFMPYTTAGTGAIGELSTLAGLGDPAALEAALTEMKAGPLYQSLYRNGEEVLLQNAAATGGLRGGDTARGLADFGSDVLARVYDDQFSKLSGLAGLGLGATGSVAGAGAQRADSVTNLLGNIGSAKASGALTRGGINAQMWQNAGSFLDSVASAFVGGGGGKAGVQAALKSVF